METALIALAALACPFAMGLMMWFMGRGTRGGRAEEDAGEQPREASLAKLKAEQSRLASEIERLEAKGGARERAPSGSREET